MSRSRCLWISAVLPLVALSACGSEPGDEGEGGASGGDGALTGGVGGGGTGGTSGSGGRDTGGVAGSGGIAGSGGDAPTGGSTSVACHEPSEAGPLTTRLPCLLSETGLYQADMETLGEGVRPFSPRFELWTDGAKKKRWISVPQGTQIDSSDMDFWQFPPGTKLWKEFVRDDVRVETRLIEKQASSAWRMVAYQWRPDQKEADAVPNGVIDASGTEHDIPNGDDCLTCHSQQPDKALGFSAIQLSHEPFDPDDPLEWTLDELIAEGLLTAPPASSFSIPGTETEQSFFGYLHANCGHCHNPRGGANAQTGLDMWLKVADLSGPVTGFSVYLGLYDVDIAWLGGEHPGAPKRVSPGSLENSAVYQRFVTKGENWSMPPLGTEITDPAGQQIFETWIQSLE